ncbi:probable chitinase 10 [Penaeus monodon]|uniref:probable chitinase 10 n=1 Tax=Penaeus monodon TaxID=6687 RepID=UPI0018A7056F|nr:probable chitinase 10 [Penaeus monodon]
MCLPPKAECVLTIVETVTDAPVTGSGILMKVTLMTVTLFFPEVEGMYAHPRDCSKFVSCANSQPSTSSCPPNLVFNAAKKVCDWPENVQCACSPDAECVLTIVETVTDAPVTGSGNTDGDNTDDCNFACPEVEGMYAHPRDCSKFVSCANSQPSTTSCPPNLVFNAAKKVCDWSENVQCTSTSDAECVLTIVETVTDAPVTGSGNTDEGNTDDCNFVCPEVEGMYAHPRDCSKFVSCANSQPSTLSCPPNLVFNAAKKVCDWPENVQCAAHRC